MAERISGRGIWHLLQISPSFNFTISQPPPDLLLALPIPVPLVNKWLGIMTSDAYNQNHNIKTNPGKDGGEGLGDFVRGGNCGLGFGRLVADGAGCGLRRCQEIQVDSCHKAETTIYPDLSGGGF